MYWVYFQSSFRLTANLREIHRDFLYSWCIYIIYIYIYIYILYILGIPIYPDPTHSKHSALPTFTTTAFVLIDECMLTSHPKSILTLRFTWYCIFYTLGQMYNNINPSLYNHTENFHCSKILCDPTVHLSPLPQAPPTSNFFIVSIICIIQNFIKLKTYNI